MIRSFIIILMVACSLPASVIAEETCADTMENVFRELGGDYTLIKPGADRDGKHKEIWVYNKLRLRVIFEWGGHVYQCQQTREDIGSYPNEPDGFRGIKWGTPLKNIKGMTYISADDSGQRFYVRKSDRLAIGDARLEAIMYVFWKGKLASAIFSFKGSHNMEIIAGVMKKRYGDPNREQDDVSAWIGQTTSMTMKYSRVTEEGALLMTSEVANKKMKAAVARSIEKGAASDF